MKTYIELKKHENILLTQFRTNKIDFNVFLYEIKIPDILNPNCNCLRGGNMTVEHVLLKCLKWSTERGELIHPLRTTDIKNILTSKKGAKTVVKMIQYTKILNQFKKAVDQDVRQRLRESSEHQEEEEDRIEEQK